MFLKLFMAMLLGVILGIERTAAHKTAGMRTFGLVSMGAALFVVISEIITEKYLGIGISTIDPIRMASQIIVGIGFLGAGLIMIRESGIQGLTTAAGLWVSAGIGVATGFGLYGLAIIATILTLFVFTILWFIEKKIREKEEGKRD